MSEHSLEQRRQPLTDQERASALFANLVIQQTNMALMFLGKVPHPESQETFLDLPSAQLVIDQLEMLGVKTKGNLDKHEDALLKQSLTTLRMAFVEAVEQDPASAGAGSAPGGQTASGHRTRAEGPPVESGAASSEAADSRKKFTKKY